jgi:hypothetical protein
MFFKFFWIEKDKVRVMIDEAIVSSLMSSLLLTVMFCTMQNVGALFVELFNQVVKLSLKYGNKTHLHQSQM